MQNKQLRTTEYQDRARDASALAEASVLDHVREKHALAAARWRELAAMNEADIVGLSRRTQAPEAAAANDMGE